jgi:hypothetical protein
MSEEWTIEGPRVLDIGGEQERVRQLSVAIVGGRVDVVTHTDSPTARVEVASVSGTPLRVRWDGTKLKVTHGIEPGRILDRVRSAFEGLEHNKVVLSISVPENAEATVSTVSASGLLAGMRAGAKANTVSGAITLDDIVGETDVNTVSGDVECLHLRGQLRVNSVSGSVTAQQSEIADVTIHTVSGDVTLDLTNSAATIGSNSVSGDVTVRAPHDGYDVTANIASGQVVVDGRSFGKSSRGQGNRHTEGRGSLRLRANAVTGNVVVLQAVSDSGVGNSAATS